MCVCVCVCVCVCERMRSVGDDIAINVPTIRHLA